MSRRPVDGGFPAKEPPSAGGARRVKFEEIEPPTKQRKRSPKRAFEAACEDALARNLRRGDQHAWDGADGGTLVGLYAVFHERVYGGVRPVELEQEFLAARSMAERVIREIGLERAVAMLRWKWARENKRRQGDDAGDFRIGWKLMFSRRMVTDFNVARPTR